MKSETSYGVIPLQRIKNEWRVNLIQHNAGHWSFPKGHLNQNESPFETASRELSEETGLIIEKLLRDEPFEENYFFRKEGHLVNKSVFYFLALVTGDLNIQKEELQDGRWFSLEDAKDQVTFPEARKLCQKIIDTLKEIH